MSRVTTRTESPTQNALAAETSRMVQHETRERRRRDALVLEANCWKGSCHGPRLETKEEDVVPMRVMEKAAVVTKSESCNENTRKQIWIILHQVPPDREVVHRGLRESVIVAGPMPSSLFVSLTLSRRVSQDIRRLGYIKIFVWPMANVILLVMKEKKCDLRLTGFSDCVLFVTAHSCRFSLASDVRVWNSKRFQTAGRCSKSVVRACAHDGTIDCIQEQRQQQKRERLIRSLRIPDSADC